MQYKNSRVRPGKEGIYRVREGFALFFVDRFKNLTPWARQRQHVDLRSAFFARYVQETSQMHKIELVDRLPQGERLVGVGAAPLNVKDAFTAEGGEFVETPVQALDPGGLPGIELPAADAEPSEESAADAEPSEESAPVSTGRKPNTRRGGK